MRLVRLAIVVLVMGVSIVGPHAFGQGNNGVWTASGTNIYNNNSGFVGIGSSATPQTALHVFGEFTVSGSIGDVRWVPRGGSGTTMMMYNASGADLRIFGASDLFTFTSSGNFGIGLGSAAPTAKLHVIGSPASSSSFVTWDGADYSLLSVRSQQLAAKGTHVFTSLNQGANKVGTLLGLSEDSTDDASNHAGVIGVGVSRAINSQGFVAGIEGDAYRAYVAGGTTSLLIGVGGYAEVGAGTATTAAALYAWAPWSPANASIGLNAGVYIENQTAYGANVTNNYQLYSASTSPVVITPSGSVGIGATNPGRALQIGTTGSWMSDSGILMKGSNPGIEFADTEANPQRWLMVSGVSAVNDGKLGLAYDVNLGAPRVVVLPSSGYVGINTPSPAYALDVNGTIHGTNVIATYQDVAEWVPASSDMTPGTVVVLNRQKSNEVMPSSTAYDATVAGVVSAKPGIILGEGSPEKARVATTGRVKVKVDATKEPITIGDLLVTSDESGTAMKSIPVSVAGVAMHRPGTIIGKALEPLNIGKGEILVLLSLQ